MAARQGFTLLPHDEPTDGRRELLEVYPALWKREGTVVARARELLHPGTGDGTDEQDASICAVAALAHAGVADPRVPQLVDPAAGDARDGWIYAPTRTWITAEP